MGYLATIIQNCEEVIHENNLKKAEKTVNELIPLFKDKIKGFLDGTTLQQSNMNKVWNLNDGVNRPIHYDYNKDLKLLLSKLKIYNDEIESKLTKDQVQVDNSININGSNVKKSNIGNVNSTKDKKGIWKVLLEVLAALTAIAAVITLVMMFI